MTVLVFGANGQLGWQCVRDLHAAVGVKREHFDASRASIEHDLVSLLDRYQPKVIINALAYTSVDRAQEESELAFRLNARFPDLLAKHAGDALLIHFSSDYVFDGHSSQPYSESDLTAPLSVYGSSKLAGELAVLESAAHALVFRSTWLVGEHGQNFAKTILRLACTRSELRVVADQWGVPTPTPFLTAQLAILIKRKTGISKGLYHLVPEGETTWHRYACYIIEKASQHPHWQDRLRIRAASIEPIPSQAYPLPAQRPLNSRLNCSRWRQALGVTHLAPFDMVLEPVLDRILVKEPLTPGPT
ncbi:MAG: dTDP-4-dehydrorhamnose reductase [Betaproteobacteria bacterium]|nr:dTDP-4-dehydrorhamnose reductase [Betaproteobacteria bacterium]